MPKKQVQTNEAGDVTGVVKFIFEDESVQELDVTTLSPAMQLRLMVHGFSQKGGDSYAGAGKEASPVAFAKESVAEVIKQLIAGDWRVTAVGGPRVTDLATAYARALGGTIEEAVELVGSLNETQTKDLRKKPKIAAALAAIAAEKAVERAKKAQAAAEAAEAAEVQA